MVINSSTKHAKYTALLSIIEVALGSFLHSFKIPLSGHFLSLNEGFLLTRASLEIEEKNAPAMIGVASALLKTLSPAGKKLTPMLAISAQAHCFSFGLYLLGNNFMGRCLGIILLSLWAFIQPIGIYFLIFGKQILDVAHYFLDKLSSVFVVSMDNLFQILLILIFTKIIISIIICILAHKMKHTTFDKYIRWASKYTIKPNPKKEKSVKNPYSGAFKDLLNPLFLISIILSILFFLFVENQNAKSIWIILRPITIGYLVFLIIRIFPVENLVTKKYQGLIKEVLELIRS